MNGVRIATGFVIGVVLVGSGTVFGQRAGGQVPMHRPGPGSGEYLPWVGDGFASPYIPASSGSSQQYQPEVVNVAPAQGEAAYADQEFANRWADLQVMIERARREFVISDEYTAAKNDMEQARTDYDAAVDSVMARLADDEQYKNLIEKKTQEQVALGMTPVDSGVRNDVATAKLRYGSMATQMEAVALANDSSVQDARKRMIAADENLRLKERRFELALYKDPEIVAAKEQMEVAKLNKAGADGYLTGIYVTRADQLGLNDQYNNGTTVYWSPWW